MMTTSTSTAEGTTISITLEHLFSVEDVFHRHFLPYLTPQDLGRIECAASALRKQLCSSQDHVAWKILCERDFCAHSKAAPILNTTHKRSFDALVEQENWKIVYKKWAYWNKWTGRRVKAHDMVKSIALWNRCKTILERHSLENILESLEVCPTPETFEILGRKASSSLLAFYAVHGGQVGLTPRSQDTAFFAGLLGSYSCYNDFYSMRLLDIKDFVNDAISEQLGTILIGISPGHPRMYLHVKPTIDDPQGQIIMAPGTVEHGVRESPTVIGHGGILTYFEHYIDRLETGVYGPACVIPNSISSRGIGLFPEMGDSVSCVVTRGIEVKSSARWFPMGMFDAIQGGLNFGYSIRIRMVEADPTSTNATTCQLVGRHWEFMDGNGKVRRVDGEAVIGKQPLFFLENGKSGYVDLGPAGDGETYTDTTFVYQSQSGAVQGTAQNDTRVASVKGTFSFMPGRISDPKGPLFHVTVGKFPLSVPSPFY